MHFSSATLITLSSIGVTYAAPFANPEPFGNPDDALVRRATYSVVNADGETSSSSAAPEVDTVFETSTVTAPGADPVPVTVTVTATPTSVPYSTPVASSTPCLDTPVRRSEIPTPSSSASFFRRGLRAAGQPAIFAREYSSSSSASLYASDYPIPTPAESLYARQWPTSSAAESLYAREMYPSAFGAAPAPSASVPAPLAARGWYSSAAGTPSVATPSASPTLVARAFNDWYPSASVSPSSSLSASVAPTLVAREWYSSVATPSAFASPSSSSVSPSISGAPIVARDWPVSPSGTPSSSVVPTSAVPLALRGAYGWYSAAPSVYSVATPSASPSLVARQFGAWGSSSVSVPVSSTFAPSATPAY